MFKKLRIKESPSSHISLEEICGVAIIYFRDGRDDNKGRGCGGRLELRKTEVKQLIKNLVDILGKM
jgi:hypothetical protein